MRVRLWPPDCSGEGGATAAAAAMREDGAGCPCCAEPPRGPPPNCLDLRGRLSEESTTRVLIVDDLPEQRDIYATLLRSHGFQVLEAEDGVRAVEVAFAARPHVIVMDVVLPQQDGWMATRQLQADPRTAEIPVIVITARETLEGRETSEDAGAIAYLLKPCDPNQILEEVRRAAGAKI